jgi:branched-chain amino acid transport system ATP-binding protein
LGVVGVAPTGAGVSAGSLSVRGITVAFGGLTALDQVSLSLTKGEVVGLIGPNGAGKTTLFNVICGFVSPNGGQVWFSGRELRGHRPHDLAGHGIARTLQGVGLWHGMTVVENVMSGGQAGVRAGFLSALLGLPRSSREEKRLHARAMEELEAFGIADYAKAMPAALPYPIQKKAALARALMAEPVLLMLDEPASGLSEGEIANLSSILDQIKGRMGVLLVEHNMDFVMSVCDRIVVLNFGQVIADGLPEEVRANPEVTTAYLGQEVISSSAGTESA